MNIIIVFCITNGYNYNIILPMGVIIVYVLPIHIIIVFCITNGYNYSPFVLPMDIIIILYYQWV
jgi:hypothetical protein